ncbi:thiamine ABC transporter ATP-binding protein [[Pasteurella] aerogenes]
MIKMNVHFDYPTMSMYFNLQVAAQEKVAIVGSSGAGKSTLLNLIAGFEFADRGEIWLNGENHTRSEPFERPVSILFQENNVFTHLTVWQNIALGIKPSLVLSDAERARVERAASAVGLQPFLSRVPTALSGGQKQRVALARCLLRDKPILLLDEPFSALDTELRAEMLTLLEPLCAEKKLTLLIVTHQPNEVKDNIDRMIHIENGQICD